MPLKLSLKPGEKFVVNGAVIQNGDRRGVLLLQNTSFRSVQTGERRTESVSNYRKYCLRDIVMVIG